MKDYRQYCDLNRFGLLKNPSVGDGVDGLLGGPWRKCAGRGIYISVEIFRPPPESPIFCPSSKTHSAPKSAALPTSMWTACLVGSTHIVLSHKQPPRAQSHAFVCANTPGMWPQVSNAQCEAHTYPHRLDASKKMSPKRMHDSILAFPLSSLNSFWPIPNR